VPGWVTQGPDLEDEGVVRWRRHNLEDRIPGRFVISARAVPRDASAWRKTTSPHPPARDLLYAYTFRRPWIVL
jgi:hypothetical protein